MWNYNKSRFYEQILKRGTHTFKKFFLIFLRRTHVNYEFNLESVVCPKPVER